MINTEIHLSVKINAFSDSATISKTAIVVAYTYVMFYHPLKEKHAFIDEYSIFIKR